MVQGIVHTFPVAPPINLHVLLLLKLLWPYNAYIWISVIIFSPIIFTLLYIIMEKPSTILGLSATFLTAFSVFYICYFFSYIFSLLINISMRIVGSQANSSVGLD